jgi:uncharacterized protein YjbI with pentapeptide repeats
MNKFLKILVDGIGPRKRYRLWVGRKVFGPFFSRDALLWGIRHYSKLFPEMTMRLLEICLDETGGHFAPFDIVSTGLYAGCHREKPRRPPVAEPQPASGPERQALPAPFDDPPIPPEPARQKLSEALSRPFGGDRRADDELRSSDLTGFSTLPYVDGGPPCRSLDLAGDYSWSDLTGSQFAPGKTQPRNDYPVILSGWFIGANLSKCRFERAHLAGDFSRADFSGAAFLKCKLSGRFNRALMPVHLQSCEISPDASFKGADLRGASARFPEPAQIHAAQIDLFDDVTVENGSKVTLHGREYRLRRPAQLLPNVIAPGRSYASQYRSVVPLALVESFQPLTMYHWLYDVSKADSKSLAGWSKETSRHEEAWGYFYLNAPDATLRGITARSLDSRIFLIGNFDRARFIESEIQWLEVHAGSFRDFDLTGAVVDSLWLHISKADLRGIRLPDICGSVWVQSDYHDHEFRFQTSPSQVVEIAEAWNCPQKCAALAERYLAATQRFSDDEQKRIRKSRARTVDELCQGQGYGDQKAQAFLALTARKNQL